MGIDRSVQSGLKSSASHGVQGQSCGCRTKRSKQPNGSQPLALTAWNVMGEYLAGSCRHRQDGASLAFCLTLPDAMRAT